MTRAPRTQRNVRFDHAAASAAAAIRYDATPILGLSARTGYVTDPRDVGDGDRVIWEERE